MTTTVKKNSRGYGYTYADLATIHDELERQGITYYQFIQFNPEAGADYVFTVLTKNGKDGEPLQGCRVIVGEQAKMSAAQAQGSALTYARRYSLLMALGWATEDNDGTTAGTVSSSEQSVQPVAPAEKPWKSSGNKVDFGEFENWLNTVPSLDVLRGKYTEIQGGHYSDKQKTVLLRMIRDRSDAIKNEVGQES